LLGSMSDEKDSNDADVLIVAMAYPGPLEEGLVYAQLTQGVRHGGGEPEPFETVTLPRRLAGPLTGPLVALFGSILFLLTGFYLYETIAQPIPLLDCTSQPSDVCNQLNVETMNYNNSTRLPLQAWIWVAVIATVVSLIFLGVRIAQKTRPRAD
jgi:hypothetical protein